MRIAATLILHNGKFLLVREGGGAWDFPGGLVQEEETFDNGAIRETFEEMGLIVKVSKLINAYYYQEGKSNAVKKIFLASIVGGKLSLPQIKEAKLFSPNELEGNFAPGVKQAIADCVNSRFGLTYYPDGVA